METKMILLKNGTAYVEGKFVKKDILISDGKIEKIVSDFVFDDSVKVVDCKGLVILPGVIDPHVHFRDPGLIQKEDFFTGSKAAAAGGITTVLDMPNTKPPTLTVVDLNDKRKIAASKSIVNYGFHFGSAVDNLSEIKKAKNVASTKLFMNHSTGNMKIEDDSKIEKIFKSSKIVAAHAEGEKLKKAVKIAKKTKKRLYLCHVSSEEEIEFLKKNKSKNIFIEVTPHHLYLTAKKDDPFLKVYPCLKTRKDNSALWKAINSGLIDTLGTDHAPHTIKEKKTLEPAGMPGEETFLALMLDAVNREKVRFSKVIELCCENPAKIFGINNKGSLKEGYDADLTIVDMKLKKKVDSKNLFTKCKWSPYNNKVLKGWPVMTIVNGNIVFDKGKITTIKKGKEVKFSQ